MIALFIMATLGFLAPGVLALHVVQILDSVVVEKDQYLEVGNFNEANFVS